MPRLWLRDFFIQFAISFCDVPCKKIPQVVNKGGKIDSRNNIGFHFNTEFNENHGFDVENNIQRISLQFGRIQIPTHLMNKKEVGEFRYNRSLTS